MTLSWRPWVLSVLLIAPLFAAAPVPRSAQPVSRRVLVESAQQPEAFRYLAFPTLLRTGDDEVWLTYKAGKSHATDPGSGLEVVRHTLSTGATALVQRLAKGM